MHNAIDAIRGCKYLYLESVSEPSSQALRLVLHEAKGGRLGTADSGRTEQMPELRALLAKASEIVRGPGCMVFEIYWKRYVAYSVQGENYVLPEPAESNADGRLFVEHAQSAYLDYLGKVTFGSLGQRGSFRHWSLYCLNHTVDVASTDTPLIEVSRHA